MNEELSSLRFDGVGKCKGEFLIMLIYQEQAK